MNNQHTPAHDSRQITNWVANDGRPNTIRAADIDNRSVTVHHHHYPQTTRAPQQQGISAQQMSDMVGAGGSYQSSAQPDNAPSSNAWGWLIFIVFAVLLFAAFADAFSVFVAAAQANPIGAVAFAACVIGIVMLLKGGRHP